MKPQHKYYQLITHISAVASLNIRRIRVNLVLSASFLPDFFRAKISRLKSDYPVRQTVLLAAVIAAIVVPSTLYVQERSRRIDLADSYRHLDLRTTVEIGTLDKSLQGLAEEQEYLRSMLLDTGVHVVSSGVLSTRLVATGYSSSVWETDDTPFITASNTRTRHGVVAMSRDLLRRYNPEAPFGFGDTIHISGLGDFIVEDSMHWRWRKRIDIWFPSREAAWNFGIRDVTITMPLDGKASQDLTMKNTLPRGGSGTSYASTSVLPR
jgi:3D (Asp-Asp-Asp) domain-containing protein